MSVLHVLIAQPKSPRLPGNLSPLQCFLGNNLSMNVYFKQVNNGLIHRANNLGVSIEGPLDSGDWELQTLRAECEVQKEEIRQLLEQVMTPEAELEREALFQDTIERNNRLEHYLKKTERRLLRAKVNHQNIQPHCSAESMKSCYVVGHRLTHKNIKKLVS